MKKLKIILSSNYFLLICLIVVIISSFIRMSMVTINENNINSFEGVVTDKKIDGDKLTLIVKNKKILRGTYYLQNEKELHEAEALDLGVRIKLRGSLTDITNNTIPNTFNYREYLKNSRIDYTMSVDKYQIINNKTNIFYFIKNSLIRYINTFSSKDYLFTFIIGNKDYLGDGVYEQYQDLGVSHIFAISGMHISMLTLILLKLLKFLKEEKRYIIIIIFLMVYMFLTNFQASVLRSAILFIILYLNRRYDFNLSTLQCLYLTIILILIVLPNMVFNIGFIYSSTISFSLIKYNFLIKGNYFMKCIKISLIAFIVSLPITINNNFEVNILSVFNNLFFVPLISFIIYPLSLLTLIIKPLDSILLFVTNLLEIISPYLLSFNIVIPKLNLITIIVYYILVFIFFKTYNKIYLLLIVVLLLFVKIMVYMDSNLYLYVLDVKQGDSMVIKYKNECIMIDTGGITSYQGEEWKKKKKYYLTDNSIRFLKSIGVDNLDYLVLTHGDYDHMGEAEHLVDNFKVNKIIFNNGSYNKLESELINKIKHKAIKYYQGLNSINLKKYKLYFLNTKIYDNENEDSNVTYLKYNKFQFLFMGDAGTIKENDIIASYNISNIDFLKVGHHGSDTSSSLEFINTIKPENSFISVGKNNKYGHPKESVLNILSNSKMYRTDLDGSIMVKIYKNSYKVQTYSP